MGEPTMADVGLYGATIAVGAEIASGGQNGRVEFLMFHDFRVGGIRLRSRNTMSRFIIKKGETAALPKPIRVVYQCVQSCPKPFTRSGRSSDEWEVTGTVFVFGKFKKMGFEFKGSSRLRST
jgi:hypothetical protein